MTNKKSVLRDWVESIIVAFLLAMVIRTFVVQAFKIPTGSMRPTLLEGDLILVKGSQGVRMEKVVEEIMAEPERKKELLVRQEKKWLNK